MAYILPVGVMETDAAWFYATPTETTWPIVKQPYDQTLVRIDYSGASSAALTAVAFVVDVSTNPQLVVSFPVLNNHELAFLLSGGIPGQAYYVTITVHFGGTTRVDTLFVRMPSSGDCACETFNPVPPIYTQLPLGGSGYVNTAVRMFWGTIPPANPNTLDQWYDTDNQLLSEWITDGTEYFWSTIASPLPPPGTGGGGGGGGGASVTISATAPSSPTVGSMWWDSTGGQMYIWYDDGTSAQWATVVNQAGGFYPLTGGRINGPVDLSAQVVTGSGATTIDRVSGENVILVFNANITSMTINGWPANGTTGKVRLQINSTGGTTIAWPSGTIWPGGVAPTISGLGRKDIILLMTDNAGVTVFGSVVGQDYR